MPQNGSAGILFVLRGDRLLRVSLMQYPLEARLKTPALALARTILGRM